MNKQINTVPRKSVYCKKGSGFEDKILSFTHIYESERQREPMEGSEKKKKVGKESKRYRTEKLCQMLPRG